MRNKRFKLVFSMLFVLMLSSTTWNMTPILAQTPGSVRDFTIIANYDAEHAEMLPEEARTAIEQAIYDWPYQITNPNFYLVSLRWEETWALGTIVSINSASKNSEPLSNRDTLSCILVKTSNEWQAAIETSVKVQELLQYIPDQELSPEAKAALFHSIESRTGSIARQQKYSAYKFPWPPSVGFGISRANYGWHDSSGNIGGNALDFYPPSQTNHNILASAPGTITQICSNPSGIQTWMSIRTENSTETLIYVHVHKNTIPANIIQGAFVSQGTILGRMVEGYVNESSHPCPMWSEGTHLHLLFPTKPFIMDGYTLTSYSNGYLKVLDQSGNEIAQPFSRQYYSSQGQSNTLCGALSGTLAAGTYDICESGIYVNSGASLHIMPGVTLNYNGHSFTVNGQLIWGP